MQRNVAVFPRPGVGDQGVDASEAFQGLAEKAPNVCFPGEVSLEREGAAVAQFLFQRFGGGAAFTVMQDDARSFGGECPGDSGTNSAGASRDEHYFSVQSSVHREGMMDDGWCMMAREKGEKEKEDRR